MPLEKFGWNSYFQNEFARHCELGSEPARVALADRDLFIVTTLHGDFNARRIERYLLLARESGARTVIVLNKADLREDIEQVVASVKALAAGATVVAISA